MLGTPFAADLESRHCFAVLPGAATIVSCGYWDNTIRCHTTHDGKLLQVRPNTDWSHRLLPRRLLKRVDCFPPAEQHLELRRMW